MTTRAVKAQTLQPARIWLLKPEWPFWPSPSPVREGPRALETPFRLPWLR